MWNVLHHRHHPTRELNELRVLRLVRDLGPISRIELARATNLHKATVTDLVTKLIRAGYLEDTGQFQARSEVGRKRRLLRFRPLAGVVAGIDVRLTHSTVAIADLNARILYQESFDYQLQDDPRTVLKRAADTLTALLKTARLSPGKLVGIGVGVQGIINCSTNTLVLSYTKKHWQGESLSAPLEAAFDTPVYVENDVKTMTLGEYLLGAAKGVRDFIHIWVGEGVGAGIMINGQLLHGITSSAGEIGYNALDLSTFDRERFPLMYQERAMFGKVLTDANLVACYRANTPHRNGEEITVATIARRAADGDAVAKQVIEEFVSLLSLLCINLVNALNPDMIVIGGSLAQADPGIAEMLQMKIHGDLLNPPAEAVRVRAASHGESAVILGAAGLVLYELFEPLQRLSVRSTHRNLAGSDVGMAVR